MKKIWCRRNEVIFDNKFTCPEKLVHEAITMWEAFLEANNKICQQQRDSSSSSQHKWGKPMKNYCKVNFDATMDKEQKKRIGLGIIVRNNSGDIMATVCSPRRLVVSPFLIAFYALWRSKELCRELDF